MGKSGQMGWNEENKGWRGNAFRGLYAPSEATLEAVMPISSKNAMQRDCVIGPWSRCEL